MKQFDNQSSSRSNPFSKICSAVLLFCCMAFSHKVSATNFTPTTFTDPDYTSINNATGVITGGAGVGLISLRSALQAADNTAGPHTITLLAGTYNITGGANIGTYIIFGSNNNQTITINGVAGSPLTAIINMSAGAFQDRIFAINVATLGATTNIDVSINNVMFTNGHLNSDPYGGGAIEFAAGDPACSLTLTNCDFTNNTIDAAAGTTGGAVNYSGSGDLVVTNCTFTGNSNDNSDGGALYYFFNNNFITGNMTVTNCTFTNNTATATGPGNGGAIGIAAQGRIAPFTQVFTANITKNSFITNTAPGAEGGAIIVDNGDAAYTVNINYNRFFNNSTTSTTAVTSGLSMNSAAGSVNATNNWWGANTNPTTAGAGNRAAIVGSGGAGILTTNPWLQLKTTASPNPICNTPAGLGNTATVTTSFLSNSAGTIIPVANLPVLIGLPITWSSTLGTLGAPQQLTIQASGDAINTFTSNGTGGSATVNSQVDNVPAADLVARATITVNTLPTVTNPVNTTTCIGGTAIFTSIVTGSPAPAIVWRIGATALVNGLQGSGSTISGQGTNTLTITNVQPGDAAINYNVQASNTCGTATSTDATLSVNAVSGGVVGSDQTICFGGDPAVFTESVASTGSGALTYQWQSSTTSCAAGFSNIGGATGTTYDAPSGLAITTFYRRVTTSTLNAVPCTANSNCITVTVNSVTGGTVAADQTICSGGDPAAFTQTVASTGTALTYQWQSSTTSCAAGFSDIGGATATTYDPPAGLLVTTYYRRVTTSTLNAVLCTANSNCITVSVNDVTGGAVGADQTICSGGDPAVFTESVASTGSGALTYQWQSSTTSCAAGFSNIGGATGTTYDAPSGLAVTTYYRRVTTSTLNAVPCTANSNCITVTINDVTGGIVGTDQTFCSGGDPAAFTESVASTGSGILTYQWQSSTTSCAAGFSNIGGATSTTYDAPAGLVVTTYYRRVTTSTLNAVACTSNSNCITVTVNNVTGGTVGSDQAVCPGGDPAAFTESVASTGGGALTYQWQSSTTSCAAGFSNIGGATGTTYDAPAGLAVTTYYRRVTTSTLNVVACTANSNCITVTVNPINTITLTSAAGTDAQTVLINTPITNITYSTTSATGATFSGLPTGVNGVWAANVVTISGTPTVAGLFNYTVTLTGGCGSITASGTINVIVCSITRTSAAGTDAQTVCINTAITNITYSTVGATGANFSGLPAGVTGNWAANVATISGTPTASGTFNYTVTLTGGGCSNTASGTITVTPNNTITLTSAAGTNAQTICINTAITNITYSTTGATGATFSGLPAGVTGNWAANVVTISGTATASGIFNYTVTLTGGCGIITATGSITVNPTPNAVATPSSQTICSANPITTIVLSGAVTGTTFNWTRDNTVTVTGIAASGSGNITGSLTNTTNAPITVTFTITPTANGCPGTSITATVLVNPTPNAVATPASQTICSASTITTIVLSGNVTGTTFNWTRDNTATVTGIAASGSGNISGTLTNNSNAPITVTFTITPTANGCPGTAITATVLVNPTPNASAAPPSQTICSGTAITPIVLTSTTTGANSIVNGGFETGSLPPWIIGSAIPAPVVNATSPRSGTFAAFLGSLNGGPEPLGDGSIYQTITVPAAGGTLSYWYRGFTTDGIAFDWQDAYISNTSGTILATIMHVCVTNAAYTQVNFNMAAFAGQTVRVVFLVHQDGFGDVTNMYVDDVTLSTPAVITYNWIRDNTVTVTGIAASGSGTPITGTLTNTTFAPVTVTFTITPTANGCVGTPTSATVLVNPTPNAVATPSSQTICSGTVITTIVLSSAVTGTTYSWTRNNTAAVTGIAASGSGNISGTLTNTTTAPVTVTFTITPTANGCAGTPITATVTVQAPLAITCPANITIPSVIGGCTAVVTYAPVVTGTPAPTFTYSFSGATTGSGNGTGSGSTFNVGVTTVTITATNSCSIVSCSFTITVTDSQLPVITTQPANTTVCVGSSASFSVVATNTLSYQWQTWNGTVWVNIAGANSATFTLNAVIFSMNTNSYRVIVTGLCSSVTSAFSTLFVNALPTVSIVASGPLALLPAQSVTLTAVVNPGGGTYQWFKNGVAIAGATGASLAGLTVDNIGSYTVRYTDLNGCVATSAAMVVSAKQSDNLYVYPNPNDGLFHIRFYNQANENITVNLYDAKGALVYNRKVVTTTPYTDITVDISNLPAGIYTVELRNAIGKQVGAKKIFVYDR